MARQALSDEFGADRIVGLGVLLTVPTHLRQLAQVEIEGAIQDDILLFRGGSFVERPRQVGADTAQRRGLSGSK